MTDQPFGAYTPAEYQAMIRREADLLLGMLAALAEGDEAARVPACPDWCVRDLVAHLGGVHNWAGLNASTGLDGVSPRHPWLELPSGAPLGEWYAARADRLLELLAATDPDEPCWTLQKGFRTAAFWSRRQSHETAMHRNDVAGALGGAYSYEAGHAADGLGEIFDVFLCRRKAYGVPRVDVDVPVLIECTDAPARWLLAPQASDPELHEARGPVLSDDQASEAAAVLRGPAAGLLFTFWRRQSAAEAGLTAEGDTSLTDRLLACTLTP
ncbi:maleylpyruvate isomerase family mycothiol-dependent enzyme [Flindersiella endophytica]